MNHTHETRLEELFVRYWDDSLSAHEQAEFEHLLGTSAAARDRFAILARQAVAAAELPATVPVGSCPATKPAGGRLWSRRRVLGYVGGGLAAGVGAVALGRWLWPAGDRDTVRVVSRTGDVAVREADGNPAGGNVVPRGGSVFTHGPGSSAVLAYPNGTTVTITGNSTVTVSSPDRLILSQGAATADVRPNAAGGATLTLVTAQVTLSDLSGHLVTLGRVARETEVEVHRGSVTASAPSGEQLGVIKAGELMTVQADGGHRTRPIPPTPDQYAWDLSRPLPEGWEVGRREETDEGAVVVPENWPDPYYRGTRMYQIRSDQPWLRGFFRLRPDSRVHVRYRAERSGEGQLCFCARTTDSRAPETGMLEWNGVYEASAPGGWRVLEVPAADLLRPPNRHAPKFGPPWVAFLVIFNTYTADLGLGVAEFRVTRGGDGA